MNRREFVAAGVGGVVGAGASAGSHSARGPGRQDEIRSFFPRLRDEVFLNAAGGTPLGTFAQEGLERYMAFQRLGPGAGRGAYVAEMRGTIRARFANLIGARPSEIALVHCTKAGEQVVLDGLDPMRHGRNVVTNDMHFTGSLHNYVGLRRAGLDVRIVRSRDWDVSLDEMAAAIDERTALVAVTLVNNLTGRIEPVRELAAIAHARGALVYADVIQAAGIVPFDVGELGIDFAACSGYKWLYGVHGVGFLYVRRDLQGTLLPDRLFPGHVEYNYTPWIERPDPSREPFAYEPPNDAGRYQPGHVSYLGYCALHEGLRFLERVGVPNALTHSLRLTRRLLNHVDADRYPTVSIHHDRSPIVTFRVANRPALERRLRDARIVVSLSGNRLRVSPAVFNRDDDVDRLAEVLNAAG